MTDTETNNAATTSTKKGLRLIKLKAFEDWRKFMAEQDKETPISMSAEAREYVDDFLLNLDWNKLVGFQAPEGCCDQFPLNSSFFHKHAREEFNLTSVPLRERLANTLSFLAVATLNAAFQTVKAMKKARIMPAHLESVSTMTISLISMDWVGLEPPPRKKTEKEDGDDNDDEQGEPPKKKAKKAPAKPRTKKTKAETDSVE